MSRQLPEFAGQDFLPGNYEGFSSRESRGLMQNRSLLLHYFLGIMTLVIFQQQHCVAQISVQQPIVENFGAATSVVVPDGGEIHLGSVGIARDARNFYGPRTGIFPRGSTFSRERSHSSLSVRATIQDLSEMDRALLNKPDGAAPLPFEEVMHVSRFLRHRRGIAKAPRPAAPLPRGKIKKNRVANSNPLLKTGKTSNRISKKYLQQGTEAEERGNKTLAKIYYRLAIRNGSTKAQELLIQLDSK